MNWYIGLFLFISVIIYLCFHTLPTKSKMTVALLSVLLVFSAFVYFKGNEEKWAFAISNEQLPKKTYVTTEQHPSVYKMVRIQEAVLLNAPIISQYPELVRGCEVTSLAMLLQYHGYKTDKLTLAEQVMKDPTPYQIVGGQISFGHPNNGFVGDIYSFNNPGLGVYHKPIASLAMEYAKDQVVDLTGSDFSKIKEYLSQELPVWVITNTSFKKLPSSSFETWITPNGSIQITYKEHSVLLTGYDQDYVYFNDPLSGEKNKKAPTDEFIQSWTQMGSQAITIDPN